MHSREPFLTCFLERKIFLSVGEDMKLPQMNNKHPWNNSQRMLCIKVNESNNPWVEWKSLFSVESDKKHSRKWELEEKGTSMPGRIAFVWWNCLNFDNHIPHLVWNSVHACPKSILLYYYVMNHDAVDILWMLVTFFMQKLSPTSMKSYENYKSWVSFAFLWLSAIVFQIE